MPSRAQIHATLTTLPTGPPLVIAIIGGTSGIGSYTAKAFASVYRNAGSKLRVYLVGRDASRAEALLTDVRSTSPGSEWRFLKANDLAMMSDVDTVCAQIKRYEEEEPLKGGGPRIDMLYMSQAFSPLAPSGPTKEGLDTQMSLLYYSRIRFILNLTPLLYRSQSPSGAHVISIFAGTMEDRIDAKNLPIGPPPPKKYGVTSVRTHVSFMKTYLFEALAEKHAGVGADDDKGNTKSDKEGNDVAFSSMRERGGGAYAVGQRGDEKKEVSYAKLRQSDTRDRVWKHTMGVLEGVQGLTR
ncbi:unnamed protein product [Alternaria alternata]